MHVNFILVHSNGLHSVSQYNLSLSFN